MSAATGPTVALLGATGAVGSAAARVLAGDGPLRLGGRRHGPLDELAATLDGPAVSTHPVDLDDPHALDAFAHGADVLLHCAAPAFAIGDRVARAAARAGSRYVDVSGDAQLAQQLTGGAVPNVAVLGAGVVPGLSALLPRLLLTRARAAGMNPSRMRVHTGGVERCSPGVARDMLLSLDAGGPDGAAYGEPLAAWRDGVRVPRALRSEEDAQAPFFDGRVALQPFLAAESERLARTTGLAGLDWFNVHPGPHVREAMRRLRGTDPHGAAAALVRAAELDLAGQRAYHLMVVTVHGPDGEGGARTVVLRSPDSYALTGTVAAVATRAITAGKIPAGVHHAGEVLDPAMVLDAVQALGVTRLTEIAGDGLEDEEGAL
ncbi:saccharopine dehydrogenase NADP-binding domain-containing protein [Pseudonocardia sp. NPDC049635]|uniref:saccharopine dehydrogenase NADP-binding domain-containing protein n=1 Tax=Pseudonocardia sp. NPDC049635 TaxID=3155506 RepID=UPI003404308D